MATIILNQDRVGNLFLYREGASVIFNMASRFEDARKTFVEDAALLAAGVANPFGPIGLAIAAFPNTRLDGTERVAVWRDPNDWEVEAQPTPAALAYLELPADFVYESTRLPGRPPVYLEARKRVVLELHPDMIAQIDHYARRLGQTRMAYIAQAIAQSLKRDTALEQESSDANKE